VPASISPEWIQAIAAIFASVARTFALVFAGRGAIILDSERSNSLGAVRVRGNAEGTPARAR
jgi:hypothetical protein